MKISTKMATGFLALLVALCALIPGCSGGTGKTELVIFEAGSLIIPFAEIERAFETLHPDIDVLQEGHGSIQVIRHVTEIGDEVDLAVVADYNLIPLLMYHTMLPDGSQSFADWTIRFATNCLGFAYSADSLYASEINEDNWYEVLARSDVRLGMADPRLDASGYRSLMLCQLAELYYEQNDIFDNIISHNISGIRVAKVGEEYNITVPEIIESRRDNFYFRGFSVQLLTLLEAGQTDFAFMYKSLAIQHGLEFLELPPEVDMSSAALADEYSQVVVHLDFQRFKSVTPIFGGEPIIYGLTIPANAHHPNEAELFIQFLLGPEGQAIMVANDHPTIPPTADNPDVVPESLRSLLE